MSERRMDLLARAIDMTETELRAALLCIINDLYLEQTGTEPKNIVANAIDAAYNPIRRTGVRL